MMLLPNMENHPRQLTGYALARNGRSASQRAALAASIILGEIEFIKPTKKQIAALLGASMPYTNQALALDPFERGLVRKGRVTLAQTVKVEPTDLQLHRIVEAAGVDRTWEALEPLI
jgi:hypothetical protein